MNTDNVVEFLRQLSLDVSLGAAAQQAASQRDAPLALARLATAHGLLLQRGRLVRIHPWLPGRIQRQPDRHRGRGRGDLAAGSGSGQGSRVEASSVTGSSASWPRTARRPWSARWSATWPRAPRRRVRPSSPVPEASIPAWRAQVGRHAIRHRQPARHAGSQQIAAGGRLPIQHFANAEHAGHGAQHQARRQLSKLTPRRADRLVDRTRALQRHRQRLDAPPSRAGSRSACSPAHSRSKPAFTPVRPSRLCKWLDSEREPRGCVTAAITFPAASLAADPAPRSRGHRPAGDRATPTPTAQTRLPSMPLRVTTNSPCRAFASSPQRMDTSDRLARVASRGNVPTSPRRTRNWPAATAPRQRRAHAGPAPRRHPNRGGPSCRRPGPARRHRPRRDARPRAYRNRSAAPPAASSGQPSQRCRM